MDILRLVLVGLLVVSPVVSACGGEGIRESDFIVVVGLILICAGAVIFPIAVVANQFPASLKTQLILSVMGWGIAVFAVLAVPHSGSAMAAAFCFLVAILALLSPIVFFGLLSARNYFQCSSER